MQKKVFESFDGAHVTDDVLQEASKLFSENYGVWNEHAAKLMGKFAKAGTLSCHRPWATMLSSLKAAMSG